jgi:hypothetical protein
MSETTEHTFSWAIGDLEPEIVGLRATIGILGHLIQSPLQVEKSEWCKVEDELIDYAKRIEALWHQAWEQRKADKEEYEAELAAVRDEAKAQKASPGQRGGRKPGRRGLANAGGRSEGCEQAVHRGRVRAGAVRAEVDSH